MLPFLLAFAAAAAATLAGCEAVRVARLSAALGAGEGLLTASWLACAASSGLAAWLGSCIGAQLAADAKIIFPALALLLAAGEFVLLRPGRAPLEPTRSFGAIAIVLVASQLAAPASLLVLALAAVAAEPELAALGGTLGSGAILTIAGNAGQEWEARLPIAVLRWSGAGLLVLAALAAGLSA